MKRKIYFVVYNFIFMLAGEKFPEVSAYIAKKGVLLHACISF